MSTCDCKLMLSECTDGENCKVKRALEISNRHPFSDFNPPHRWNIRQEGEDLLICKGDHEKYEGCIEFRYVPSTEADKWKLKYQTLMYQNLSDILDECDEHDWLRVALNPELSRINKLLTKDEKL